MSEARSTGRPPKPFCPLRTAMFMGTMLLMFAAPALAQQESSAGSAETAIDATTAPEQDRRIRDRLQGIYAEIEAMDAIAVTVSTGVVTLSGSVDSQATAARALRLAGQVEGVVDVEDNLEVDRALDTRLDSTRQQLGSTARQVAAALPILGVALLVFLVFWLLGRWVGRRQRWFVRITPNVFIAELLGQITHLAFIVVGLVLALTLVDATALLGTILGAAGIVGLAIGFAVRDTVENYIASILLSLRNPFSVNDHVDINGQQGNVVKLTSRATILLSPEGNHIRIPNASVFKAVIVNYTRRPERRFEFDVGVDTDHDLQSAQQVALDTLRALPGVLAEPPPLVIVQSLGDSSVVLRCYGWVDQDEYSFVKVQSESIRRVKEAFDAAGIVMPEPIYRLKIVDRAGTPSPAPPTSSHRRAGEPTGAEQQSADVAPDRTIEQRVIADAKEDQEQNLLSGDADKEL